MELRPGYKARFLFHAVKGAFPGFFHILKQHTLPPFSMLQTRKRHPFRVEPPRIANYSEFSLPRAHDKQRNYWQRLAPFFGF